MDRAEQARLRQYGSAQRPRGRRWQAFSRAVADHYGGLCHLCDHGGARQADHLTPRTEQPDAAWKLADYRPAHGVPGNRCPVCGLACNQIRGAMSVERARRIIAERIAGGETPLEPKTPLDMKTPLNAKKPGAREDPGAGRVW